VLNIAKNAATDDVNCSELSGKYVVRMNLPLKTLDK